ncbi:MAG: ATP-binding protein [Candidatus Thorarchaeota archaeon]
MTVREEELPMKPRARLMLLLGEQLIRDETIAVSELVKNAYDADATNVRVEIHNAEKDSENAIIVIEDDGSGMDWETVTRIWLEPGTEHRKDQRGSRNPRTSKFGRLPLGEKGIGRFAAHKLGQEITMITRRHGHQEVFVKVDWSKFERAEYLEDVRITVTEREPKLFRGKKSGTRIEIRQLKGNWTRGKFRKVHRSMTSICSPFGGPDEFTTNLVIEPDYGYLEGLLEISDVLDMSLFNADVHITEGKIHYNYEFIPSQRMKLVKGRKCSHDLILPQFEESKESNHTDLEIGPIDVKLRIYDRTPRIMRMVTADVKGLSNFLNNNGGIRVYRDGVRVYDYGEPDNDWLRLGERRVNFPGTAINNNIVIGAVLLKADASVGLIEKTNREGFVESSAFNVFRESVMYSIAQIEMERNQDKKRLRVAYGRDPEDSVISHIEGIRKELKKKGLQNEFKELLDKLERRYKITLDQLLTTAGAGLSFFVLVHEMDRLIGSLRNAIKRGIEKEKLEVLTTDLFRFMRGIRQIIERRKIQEEKAGELIERAVSIYEHRFRFHNIEFVNGIKALGCPDFKVKCNRAQIIMALTNLIDNSIYWLGVKNPKTKKIYIGTYLEESNKFTIVISDNGPGFIDEPDVLVEPFFTRKPAGTGLGLYIVDEIMRRNNGTLVFPQQEDVSLPRGIKKALIALVFIGDKK